MKYLIFICAFLLFSCTKNEKLVRNIIENDVVLEFNNEPQTFFDDIDNDINPFDDIIESNSMNKINASAITFELENRDILEYLLIGNEGNHIFELELNIIIVDYWKKNIEFDREYQRDNRYYPDRFTYMEEDIINGTNNFQGMFFEENIRKNVKNEIIFIDSFCFSVFEAESIFLSRRIFLTTDNYNIRITFNGLNEFNAKLIEETPKYFRIRTAGGANDVEVTNETKEIGWPVWDYRNNAIEMFGNDIINNVHESITVNNWFLETENILNGIDIK